MIIYKITNTINNKIYIGQTTQTILKRWKRHTWNCTKKRNIMLITKAIIKYGDDKFKIEEIDTAKDINELNEKEIFYIKKYNSVSPNGYNISLGGGNFIMSKKTRKKISESNKGKTISDETRKRLSDSHKGYIVKESTKKKLSKINKLKIIDKKVRDAASEKNSKGYILIKENNLYFIRNMKKFSKINKHCHSNLSSLVSGKKESYKGFKLFLNFGFIDLSSFILKSNKYKNYFNIYYYF